LNGIGDAGAAIGDTGVAGLDSLVAGARKANESFDDMGTFGDVLKRIGDTGMKWGDGLRWMITKPRDARDSFAWSIYNWKETVPAAWNDVVTKSKTWEGRAELGTDLLLGGALGKLVKGSTGARPARPPLDSPSAPKNFSNPKFGLEVHARSLFEQTGTSKGDWIIRTKPGQKGVDATYIGDKDLGFRHAELKPRSPNGFNEFNGQVDRWQQSGHIQPGEKTSLWFYNEQGVIGQGHISR
jgi:hypothetical protein